jgi:putative ABC transport system permease protein
MRLTGFVTIAWRAVLTHRLRAMLTALGVIIGIASVIVLVGLGTGLQAGFNAQFGALGTQVVVTKVSGFVPGGRAAHNLKDSEVLSITHSGRAPDVRDATPVVAGSALASLGPLRERLTLTASLADYLDIGNRKLAAGSFFTEEQARTNARVVVLGIDPVEKFFGGDPAAAIGRTVRLGRGSFKVIGVVAKDGQQDETAVMPIGTARAYLIGGTDVVDEIIVRANSLDAVPAARDQVSAILDQEHGIRDPAQRDFETTALRDLLDTATEFVSMLTVFIAAIAGISLVVGAIGIANIMLVSVTDRTREIGIRKAIGATRRAIMKQFLIESIMLAGLGGLAGIGVGVGIIWAAREIIPRFQPTFGPPEISPAAILVAFTVSLFIGLLAGGYPAWRASRLQPIEALRFE